jgi:hypothetical protein
MQQNESRQQGCDGAIHQQSLDLTVSAILNESLMLLMAETESEVVSRHSDGPILVCLHTAYGVQSGILDQTKIS